MMLAGLFLGTKNSTQYLRFQEQRFSIYGYELAEFIANYEYIREM